MSSPKCDFCLFDRLLPFGAAEENKPSVIGEFHFSRYPDSEWRKELVKMKAGAWPFKQASGKIRAARHGEKVNYVFVDGHVEARRPEEILEKKHFPVLLTT
ncbi:hypothetical protein EBZ02_05205 [bacterium]|nr:hypothetical protein [bacterium]